MKAKLPPLFVLALWVSALTFGCEKDNIVSPPEPTVGSGGDTIYVLELLNPVEIVQPAYCCIEFAWFSNALDSSRLLVAADSNFQELVLDTLVDGSRFLYRDGLAPKTTYYWAVQVEALQETASFTSEDLISPYEGAHDGIVSSYVWRKSGESWDTSYHSSLDIMVVEGNKLKFATEGFSSSWDIPFYSYLNMGQSLFYYSSGGSISADIRIDLQTDSIFGGVRTFHQGGGGGWSFRGKAQ